jgi:hypothetical protein
VVPSALSGRVQTSAFQDVADAAVELFEPLVLEDDFRSDLERSAMVLRATARSDRAGRFTFDRLSVGRYLVVATDSALGRGRIEVRSLGDPAVVTLVPPSRASGRVLRDHRPVGDVRVRFVPAIGSLIDSTDPAELGLEEALTDGEGRFVLALPFNAAGTLQMTAADGAAARVPVATGSRTETIAVGDVVLPAPLRVLVRALQLASCSLAAVGPLGSLGLAFVRAAMLGGGLYAFDFPEPGDWAVDVRCGDGEQPVDPAIISASKSAPGLVIDIRPR